MRTPLLVALTLLIPAVATAQTVEVDADYRIHDVVYVKGIAEPLRGTILKGRAPGPHKLVIQLRNNIKTSVKRDDVTRIIGRETPAGAFRSRSKAIRTGGDAALHRRLAEWGVKHSLREPAEAELLRAIRAAKADPKAALGHRERLVTLLQERAAELDGESKDPLFEQIMTQAIASKVFSPRLALARAQITLFLGLTEQAVPLLKKARDALETKAKGPPPPDDGGGEDGGGGEDDGGGDDGAGGDDDGGGGEKKDDDGADDEPKRDNNRQPRRIGRDGEPVPPPKRDDDGGGGGGPAPAAPKADDNGTTKLPGLTRAERALWKQVLLTLAQTAERLTQRGTATATYRRVLEVYPQDGITSIGLARTLVSVGKHDDAVTQLTEALRVAPQNAELLRTRGQVHFLKGADREARTDLRAALGNLKDGSSSEARSARTALGLTHLVAGRFGKAKRELEAADSDPGFGPARLARGLLSELSGDSSGAEVHYDQATTLLGPKGLAEAAYLRSFARKKAKNLDGAKTSLEEALRAGYDFQLVMRALVDLAKAKKNETERARLVELLVRSAKAPSADQLAALGRVYLAQKRIQAALDLFTRGLKQTPNHLPCLRGLAFCAYAEDQRDKARGLFKQILAGDPKDAWATQGLRNLEEARTRRVWTDTFERKGPSVLNAWKVESSFGVNVKLQGQRLRFSGKQANEAEGKTVVWREVRGETVVKFEATFGVADTNQARCGLRLELGARHLVFLRDPRDDTLYMSVSRNGGSLWADAKPLGSWPGSGNHTLAIDVEDAKLGKVGFTVDGQRRGGIKIGNISRVRTTRLVLYGQGTKLDDTAEFSVDVARVYVLRAPDGPRKKGF